MTTTEKPIAPGLSRSERKIYNALFESPTWFVSRAELWALLYTHSFDAESRALDQVVKRLRTKLPAVLKIETVYGRGYKLKQQAGA